MLRPSQRPAPRLALPRNRLLPHTGHAYSSGRYFDGFSRPYALPPPDDESIPVAKPRTNLLKKRWRWIGLIDPEETPPAARLLGT